MEEDVIKFSLTNGEKWLASPYGKVKQNSCRVRDYAEIEAEEILRKLKECSNAYVELHHMSFDMEGCYYDIIDIEDSRDDKKYGGDREVKITLGSTKNANTEFSFGLDFYESKHYINENKWQDEIIYIGLPDAPFTRLSLSLFYGKV